MWLVVGFYLVPEWMFSPGFWVCYLNTFCLHLEIGDRLILHLTQISLHPPADVDGPQLLKDLIIWGETTSKWMKLGQAESNQTQTRSQPSRPDWFRRYQARPGSLFQFPVQVTEAALHAICRRCLLIFQICEFEPRSPPSQCSSGRNN